jgi:hypothetical protein
MRTNHIHPFLKAALRVAGILSLAAVAAFGQQQVSLTAAATTNTMPDGTAVPMWGYTCTTVTVATTATCAKLNPNSGTWSPVIITVPTGQDLQINLTNNLPASIPTSLVIMGQFGGGLGTPGGFTLAPDHTNAQPVTWPIAGTGPGVPPNVPVNGGGTPPQQGQRVRSFGTEVATGATASLLWTAPKPGTYLLASGSHPSIQVPMGPIGMVVVTTAPTVATPAGTAYPAAGSLAAVTYNAESSILLSEIDPVQNNAVNTAVGTAGFAEDTVWSAFPGACGDPTVHNCYPPAVNYPPLYYLMNGVAFSRGNAPASLFAASTGTVTTTVSGTVLVRLVNAGLRMHVPSIVGAQTGAAPGFSLIAEDGNRLPGVPRVQSEVFLPAGKTYDVMINVPAAALPIFDRELSLASNATGRDGGMLAYIGVNGAVLPTIGAFAAPAVMAVADKYFYHSGQPLTISDPAKGVISNDLGISGVQYQGTPPATLTFNTDGTLAYTGTTDLTFNYCGNGQTSGAACAQVQLLACTAANGCPVEAASNITCTIPSTPPTYQATGTSIRINPPGLLGFCKDAAGYPLTVGSFSGTGFSSLSVDPNGGFVATALAGTSSLTFTPTNSQGTPAATSAAVTINFPAPTGLVVSVLDGKDKTPITDYRWIIEEDRTFYINPNCTTNPAPVGCQVAAGGIVPTFGTNFHTSYMPVVATGCTGQASCEGLQSMYDNGVPCTSPGVPAGCSATAGTHINAVCDVGNGVCRPDSTGNGFTPVKPDSVYLDPTKRYYMSVLPGDAANPFQFGNLTANCVNGSSHATDPGIDGVTSNFGQTCGHGMGGAPLSCVLAAGETSCSASDTFGPVTILTQPAPFPPAKLSVFVFEDDFPLNGEHDANGGIDVLATNEQGLGSFQITLFDDAGGTGDSTGQPTYDMFNQPLSNSLAGTIDPATKLDACPVSAGVTSDVLNAPTPVTSSSTTTYTLTGAADPTLKMIVNAYVGYTVTTGGYSGVIASNTATTLTLQLPGWTPSSPLHLQPANGTVFSIATGLQKGITGMIVTCPRYESDGLTLSPLAGQAIIGNLYPGRYGVVATPNADRIARGEEWLQTNTLDGQKAHDSFLRIGEPSYFQEFGPAAWHVSIGFANPAIINGRKAGVCNGTDPNLTALNCNHTVKGTVTTERMSRTPDERLYSSGSNGSFSFTQCYVSLGDTDGEDFAFTKCNADGSFTLTGIPDGDWRITVFDQWNDMLVDGLSTPVGLGTGYGLCTGPGSSASVCNLGDVAMNQWQANIYTQTFFDSNGNGVRDDGEAGLALVATNIRFRDGSYSNFNNTDLDGNAGFNEVFPLFSWYVLETDTTRYKSTGTHVVYDAGGPADGTTGGGPSMIAANMANTTEAIQLPTTPQNLRVPGAFYCTTADCADAPIPPAAGGAGGSTGRVDPGIVHPYGSTYGWQGFSGQNSFIEFGKKPFQVGENGGIHGHVVYASTRPFDDPSLLLQLSWEPLVPNVVVNLYQEGTAPDGSQSLTLVDTTKTSSFDAWAQGFRTDGVPNMNCPGQGRDTGTNADLFFFSLYNQPNYLDFYNSQHGGSAPTPLPANSQFKCYDGMHNWNQLQPAPYDGMYKFPSVLSMNPSTGKPAGTNCTICGTLDSDGNPMLPAGKYVVEVVVPPGYELVKEEDKNILIGDNYIAPPTVQFPGLGGAIYIIPDQAAIGATYNPTNYQNPTTDLGATPRHEGDTGSVEQFWPCVGQMRIVPDYISLFPQSTEVSPFAGAMRPLCDRKEVTLNDQSSALAKFYIFTSTHVAAYFTGVITDDFTSEFDPFSPQFGEKFSPANLPVAIKDWAGNEIARVYSDHWGSYNGLTYSTWEVNPPNPTGYAPTMMVTCMNDPGTGATPDPLYNSSYSQFCYEIPFMPGQTQYMDTPVVPTSAFAGAGYNNPDCDYPDGTPAIKQVNGDGNGPWVSAPGHTITITSLGDVVPVNNYGYSGPSATTAPFNQKTVTRNYGFGPRPTNCPTTGDCLSATIGGIPMTNVNWTDGTITGTVPAGVPACKQQQAQYSGVASQCGQLMITAANGKQTVDAVMVTIESKIPKHVPADYPTIQSAINAAAPGDLILVDPGVYNELLLMWKPVRLQGAGSASTVINANTHPAGKLDAWRAQVACLFGLALNGQPTSNGTDVPLPGANIPGDPNFGKFAALNAFDPTGTYQCGSAAGWQYYGGSDNNPQVDRIPLEGILGWDTTVNGNLAQLLQEPSLMGAYEGAGITVLSKGVRYPAGVEIFGGGHDNTPGSNIAHEGQFPESATQGTNLLTNRDADCLTTSGGTGYSSNFLCNPSRIDGLSVTNSSQGGGGIFVHGWAHDLEISNNRVYNNTGTLTGGITVGQGESPDALVAGNNGDPLAGPAGFGGFDQQPWTCVPGAVTFDATNPILGTQNPELTGFPDGTAVPFCYNVAVNLHNNYVTRNSSIGDEVFSGTPAGAGGVTFCTGSDYYKFQYNWICGNLSTGDGGGVTHVGFSYNDPNPTDGFGIQHNTIIFNQSTNPTVATNGGGLIVMGAAPDSTSTLLGGAECGAVTDVDCTPGLSDGTGPGLVINANLIMGNGAESGSGGGIRFQDVNGTEVGAFPNGSTTVTGRNNIAAMYGGPGGTSNYFTRWSNVIATNNIIVNNVAGWDGGGVSFQDALAVKFINNTVASNDTTASAGPLFNTLGAPLASAPGCTTNCSNFGSTATAPQVAGLVSMRNTSLLTTSMPTSGFSCPTGNGTTSGSTNCRNFSVPLLNNNVFWQNRSFYIGVGSLGTGTQNQQNVVALFNATSGTPAASQAVTGGCPSGATYWDIGAHGDTGPGNHTSGLTLAPSFSLLTNSSETGGGTNNLSGTDPEFITQYCNGSRVPPENGGLGYQVPAGISDATVPNPIFSLSPAATVDEGNNWVNINWGPLAMTHPVTGAVLGNYTLRTTSRAIDFIASTGATAAGYTAGTTYAPTDFFGHPRPDSDSTIDIGAVEFQGTRSTGASVSPTSLAFGVQTVSSTSPVQTLTLLSGTTTGMTGVTLTFTAGAGFARATAAQGGTGSCGTAPFNLGANSSCTINVVFRPTAGGPATGTLTFGGTGGPVAGSPVSLTGTGVAQLGVAPSAVTFTTPVIVNRTSATSQTVTLTNGTGALVTGIALAFSTPQFSQPTGATGGTCTTTLAASTSCTISMLFTPATVGGISGILNITSSVNVVGQPVGLTGTGVGAQVSPTSLSFGSVIDGNSSAAQTLTLTNTAAVSLTGINVAVTAPFARATTAQGGAGTCTATLATNSTCTINVVFSPTTQTTTVTGTATITGNYGAATTVVGSPVSLDGTGVAPTLTATVSPSSLAFGTWFGGSTSGTMNLTVTNTGNSGLNGFALAFGGGTPQPYSRVTTGTFPAGAPNCGTTLALGASCTIKVQFAAPGGTPASYPRTLTVAYTGATVTPASVSLTGTSIATRPTDTILAPTITLRPTK